MVFDSDDGTRTHKRRQIGKSITTIRIRPVEEYYKEDGSVGHRYRKALRSWATYFPDDVIDEAVSVAVHIATYNQVSIAGIKSKALYSGRVRTKLLFKVIRGKSSINVVKYYGEYPVSMSVKI